MNESFRPETAKPTSRTLVSVPSMIRYIYYRQCRTFQYPTNVHRSLIEDQEGRAMICRRLLDGYGGPGGGKGLAWLDLL